MPSRLLRHYIVALYKTPLRLSVTRQMLDFINDEIEAVGVRKLYIKIVYI